MSAGIYVGTGMFLAVLGLVAAFRHDDGLHRLVALNVAGSGVFLALVAGATATRSDPIAHALVLTGIVVAVSVTGVALVLMVRLAERSQRAGRR